MCGIVGCIGRNDPVDALMGGLRSLEYRGYDSAGIALGPTIQVLRRSGELDALEKALETTTPEGTFGIGHTRWSTAHQRIETPIHTLTKPDGLRLSTTELLKTTVNSKPTSKPTASPSVVIQTPKSSHI